MLDGAQSAVGIDFHQTHAGIGAEDVRYLPMLSHCSPEKLSGEIPNFPYLPRAKRKLVFA
jgi:hypothetical protein